MRHSIRVKFDFVSFFCPILFIVLFLNCDYTNTLFFVKFVSYLTLGERSSGSVGHKDSSWKKTKINMNGRGQSF